MSRRDSRSRLLATGIPTLSLFVLAAALFAAPAAAYEAVQVTEGGTINGKVVYQGEVTTRKIVPTKDSETCGGIREEPLIGVGPAQGDPGRIGYLEESREGEELARPA